jgi:hypothetical protein
MLVNLVAFPLVYYRVSWIVQQQWHYAFAFAASSEVSILANFFTGDAVTCPAGGLPVITARPVSTRAALPTLTPRYLRPAQA